MNIINGPQDAVDGFYERVVGDGGRVRKRLLVGTVAVTGRRRINCHII